MEEMLAFVETQITLGNFIGLNTREENGELVYTVDYWEHEIAINELGEEIQIRAGKQQVFTI